MRVNFISNSLPNVGFEGTKRRTGVRREFITDETAKNLWQSMYADEYYATLKSIKDSKKRIPIDTLKDEVYCKVKAIKYPGSYPTPSPDRKLLSLLSYVKKVQPKDFNAVLKHLVESIAH